MAGVPPIKMHITRGTTEASKRRHTSRLRADIDNRLGDLVNLAVSQPLGAHATKVVATSANINVDPPVALTWQSAIFDIDSMWAASPNPTRLTAVTKGIYQVTAHGDWTVSGGGTVVLALYVNGVQLSNDGSRRASVSIPAQGQTETWSAALNATDYVELFVQRQAGATTSITASFVAELLGTN